MYIVASLWEIKPGREADFVASGSQIAEVLAKTPGVSSFLGFHTGDGHAMAVISYEDKAAYDRIVSDPNGPFAKAAEDAKIEELGTWVQSWRGEQTH